MTLDFDELHKAIEKSLRAEFDSIEISNGTGEPFRLVAAVAARAVVEDQAQGQEP